ncbi:MAG: aminoacyl-tRNA hydrolase [Caulobacteraceae bacterium]|nr:aminoacyl-tRNA hydrolase [Caulobacter sp.]
MIPITHFIAIDEREVVETFIRASGPGGQHVNTTASAVQLRFDALGSPNLPDDLKSRLRGVAGSRMTQDGTIVITAESFRSQGRNREDALERLVALLREAAVRKRVRRATRPTLASKKRRLEAKGRRSAVKADRRSPTD